MKKTTDGHDLREKLRAEGKTRWLDIGCGFENLQEGFNYSDILPETKIPEPQREKYLRVDMVSPTEEQFGRLGTFDLVRMQHAIEHWTPEDGLVVLKNCARLLNPGGILLVSGPDLAIFVDHYAKKDFKTGWYPELKKWSEDVRIPQDAPDSFHFSMFAYNELFDPHLWCYDVPGVIYQLERAGFYKDIRSITTEDPLASEPFTHNRPPQDFCVMAIRK